VNANQLHTPTFYYMHECQDLQFQFLDFLLFYFMNNRNGLTYIGTFQQNVQCFDISRGLRDPVILRLITERDRVPHVCSNHIIKYWLSIGRGLSRAI